MFACIVGAKNQHVPSAWQVALLGVIPRVRLEPACVWADLHGMPAESTVATLAHCIERHGETQAKIGVAAIPIVAEVATRCMSEASEALVRTIVVPRGEERRFLDPLPIDRLCPESSLANLLDAAGLECCHELANVTRESVEVRFGAEGARLWRLARADDTRLIFDPLPRTLPAASLEWTDYAIKRAERLLFVINGLCESVCKGLSAYGEGAMALTLRFSLAGRTTYALPLRAGRPTASQTIWMRIIRLAVESLVLPDAVVGITLHVDALGPVHGKQGDLFDLGFSTARAAEAGLAQVLDDQGDVIVWPANTRHHLPDRRTTWMPADALAALERSVASSSVTAGTPVTPALTLQLLARPQRIAVATVTRRHDDIPRTYRDGTGTYTVVEAAGPDCVSGERWAEPYARAYFRCVTDAGQLVWLYRDARSGAWYLHGWWD